jgi:FtsP/CotA-like multicopper oxidase with cupredoxin domain
MDVRFIANSMFIFIVFMSLYLTEVHGQNCSMTSPCKPLKGGQPFQSPLQVSSKNGVLNYNLVVDIGEVKVDWLTMKTRLFNSMFPGPTFRLKPGDKFNLHLKNNLSTPNPGAEPTDPYTKGSYRFPNTTNIHTHGLHISPLAPQDETLIGVEPQGSYQYRYEILADHNPGTFWYHPHKDGSVNFQVLGLMSGAIIIEDTPGSALANVDEVEVVLQPLTKKYFEKQKKIGDYFRLNAVPNPIGNNTNNTFDLENWISKNDLSHVLVNGILLPVLQIEAGKLKRFRIINCGGRYAMSIKFTNVKSCDIKVIAFDGIYLKQPKGYTHMMILPGNRVDVLLLCSNPENFTMESTFPEGDSSMGGHPEFTGKIMSIHVINNGTHNDTMITTLPQHPSFLTDLQNINESEIHGRFAIELSRDNKLNREFMTDVHNYRFNAKLGTIQEWYFYNSGRGGSHPMHIHVNSFQIVKYSKYTGPISEEGEDDTPAENMIKWFDQSGNVCKYQDPLYQSYKNKVSSLTAGKITHPQRTGVGYVTVGEWRDVVLVPPLSNVTIRFKTDRVHGPVVLHCHRTDHEDKGMMMVTQIVKGDAWNNATNIATGKTDPLYAQACMENSIESALGISKGSQEKHNKPGSAYRVSMNKRFYFGTLIVCVVLAIL